MNFLDRISIVLEPYKQSSKKVREN